MAETPGKRRIPQRLRGLPFNAPPRAWALSEWALLPIRIFFGGTFLYGGLQKLSNPTFFQASSPFSIQSQLKSSTRVSPIGSLLVPFQHVAVLIGIVIAVAEIAIGVGTLLGLWGRLAAIGGAILSFNLFLTVSFHASPFYTGSDIVFFFGWLTLILAGGGTRLSLDGWIARRAAHESSLPDPTLVAIPFSQVHATCGFYRKGHCAAQDGSLCAPPKCPVLEGPRASLAERGGPDDVDRRTVIIGARTAVVAAGATVIGVGAIAGLGRLLATTKGQGSGRTISPPTTTPGSSGGPGTVIGAASGVPVNSSATFTIPSTGDPGIVISPKAGEYVAYDAVCPHAGCTVGYFSNVNLIVCPCHGSQFDVETGNIVQGPAPHGLTKLTVTKGTNGDLYIA